MMELRQISPAEQETALKLIWETFLRFEAPDYPQEGIDSFRAFLDDTAGLDALCFIGAFFNGVMRGVLASREGHICCLFVEAGSQRQGVGTALWKRFLIEDSSPIITVHASPFGVPFYHRLGFVDTDAERISDGIRYPPMIFRRAVKAGGIA